jgi:hypothetical protein
VIVGHAGIFTCAIRAKPGAGALAAQAVTAPDGGHWAGAQRRSCYKVYHP